MADVTAIRWESLRQRRSPHEFILEPVEEDFTDCQLGIDAAGKLHFLVAVATDTSTIPPDLQSIEVRLVDYGGTCLDVSARSHHEDLFTMLVNKILYAIRIERRDPATSVEATIDELRAALRPVAQDLGVGEQIGLFGELWVLSNVLFPSLGTRACHLWSGPLGERHDFAGDAVHIEVKTTTKADERHEISRLDQLRAPAGKRLLLASVLLERSIAGVATIATLADEIIMKLGVDGRAIDVFETKLKSLGWHDDLRQSGSLLRFNLRDAHVFVVEGGFPRLPDDYMPPRSVMGIRYTIDVAARSSLSATEVEAILQAM
ncbi:PD-(D/E)XK motif protein [Corallococcus sp. AB030]|uniref:PD-(D/E)XK motif protein n=1 Tax=Corallococcus sp. AB030 TaxID=2316716 RepID=UPI000ED0861D|nr:PD-(D/E)XK motif protein [Corallococcus sp. AB030]RKI15396.1 PD-(D/E)XK motif protein [Corallococcus sp. AB030]